MNRLRLWGILIGMGFSLGITSTVLTAVGNELNIWRLAIVIGFGLGVGSLFGLWRELRKPKR